MTDKSIQPGDGTRGLSAAFDWRAGRTWAVILGSALAAGTAAALVALFVSVVSLGLPSAVVSSQDAAKAALIGALLFVLVIFLMGWLATRGLGQRGETPAAAAAPAARRAAFWLDLSVHLLWLVVFALPPIAMQHIFFSLPDETGGGIVTVVIYLMGLILGPIFLPDLLRRWGRRKAARDA